MWRSPVGQALKGARKITRTTKPEDRVHWRAPYKKEDGRLKRIDFAFGPKDAGMETLAETEQQPIKGVPAPKAARLCVFVCVYV